MRPLAPATDARAVGAMRRVLAGVAPDLVHTHMAKAGTVTRTAARTLRHRPALVHTFHGHVLEGYFRPAVQRAFVEVERALARMTDVLIAVSPQVRDDLLDLRIGTPDRYRVIPLGLDLDAHRRVSAPSGALRAQLGLADDVPLVGCVGRLVPIKDVPTLLDAIAAVPDAHLAVVGDGELRAELEARSTTLGLERRVHFTGWWHDVPSLMADLDVVALSSRNEGTPVALIEAGACARAVVATDVGGVRSVVEDGVTGLVVPQQDPPALAGAISALLADPARRAAMGAAGRIASARFDQDRLVEDIRALYDEVLTSRGR